MSRTNARAVASSAVIEASWARSVASRDRRALISTYDALLDAAGDTHTTKRLRARIAHYKHRSSESESRERDVMENAWRALLAYAEHPVDADHDTTKG